MTAYADLTVQLNLETRAWYLDKFGIERECIVIRASGMLNAVLAVYGLDGKKLDVPVEDLYYVPQSEQEGGYGAE